MPDDAYGVLLLSFSRHSHQRNFVPLYQDHPRTRLIAVADDDDAIDADLRALNRQWAADLGIPYIGRVDEALHHPDVHVVSLAHDIERRAALARAAAAAGKHLWIDKFPGATVAQCDAVVDAVQRAGITAIVPSYHYGHLVRHARRVLEEGAVGTLLGAHADVLFAKGWPRPIDDGERRAFRAPAGRWKYPELKRELFTVGAYAVGLLQACLGRITHVAGHGGAFFFPEHARTGTEDFATLTLCDEEGRLGTLCAGRVGVGTHPAGGPSVARLVGTESTVTLDAKRPALHTWVRDGLHAADLRPADDDPMQWASGPPALQPPLSGDVAGLAAALDDLVDALDAGRPPLCDVARARDLVAILLAGYRAIESGDIIDPREVSA